MKIFLLITSKGHGKGGHFYSLLATAQALSLRVECHVVNIGTVPSPVLERSGFKSYQFLKYEGSLASMKRKLSEMVEHYSPDVLHAFDPESLYFSKIVARKYKKKVVHTKCGGPNPAGYYPAADSMILYSQENKDYFESKKKYSHSSLYLIPNRVSSPPQDKERIGNLKKLYCIQGVVFLRIARLSRFHEGSIEKSISLVKALEERGVRCGILIIGAVQDRGVENRLRAKLGSSGYLESSDKYTMNASSLIDFSDVVIGSGRGAMEACSLGKLVLSPVSNLSVPILINQENILRFLDFNFSGRLSMPEESEEKAIEDICRTLNCSTARRSLENYLLQASFSNFDIHTAIPRIIDVYGEAKVPSKARFEHMTHGLSTYRRLR